MCAINREIASDNTQASGCKLQDHLEGDMYLTFLEAPDPSVCTSKLLLGLVTNMLNSNSVEIGHLCETEGA